MTNYGVGRAITYILGEDLGILYTALYHIGLAPVIGILVLIVTPSSRKENLKLVALISAFYSFFWSLIIWVLFSDSRGIIQYYTKITWKSHMGEFFTFGVDGISLFFIILSTLLVLLCILASWDSIAIHLKEFLVAFLFLNFVLIGAFCSLNLLTFYVFFESTLIPMFLIIGFYGSRERKMLAAYYFFLYTMLGSVLMLLAILYIRVQVGTVDYATILVILFSYLEEKVLWLAFFLAFASKVPMLPVHLWLPEAHVEAPTAGSVILAGVLLKLGIYGFIRFSLPLFPKASIFFTPLVYTIAVVGIVYSSFTAIRQTDLKRIIAYTSIAHMNLVILGVFSFNINGIEGAIMQSLSHGLVSSALFLIIGIVYDRFKTRIVRYYGGLTIVMPVYSLIFLFFTLANISFPGTSNFVGEFLVLAGIFKVNTTVTFIGATGIIIGGVYSLWLFNRVAFGNLKIQYSRTIFLDLNFREFVVFVPLIFGTLFIGVYPSIFLVSIHASVTFLIELINFKHDILVWI
jgi:proton-translocating NADH-quinone oxidoreductase chain M